MKTLTLFLLSGIVLFTSCITVNKYSRGYDDDLYYSRDERRSSYEHKRYNDDYEEDRDESRIIYDDTDTYTVYSDDCYSCLSWNVGIGFGWGWNYGWWTPSYGWSPVWWTPYYAWSPGWYYRSYYSAYYYDPYWGWDGWGRPGSGYYDVRPRQYGPRYQRDNDLVNTPGGDYNKRNASPAPGDNTRYTSRPRRTSTYTRTESSSGAERIINNGNNTETPAYRSRPRRSEPQPAVGTPSERPARRIRIQESGSDRPSPRRERIREGGTGTSAPRRERSYDSGGSSPSRSGSSSGSSGSDRPTRSPR